MGKIINTTGRIKVDDANRGQLCLKTHLRALTQSHVRYDKNQLFSFNEYYNAVQEEVRTNKTVDNLAKVNVKSNDALVKQLEKNKWMFIQAANIYIEKNDAYRRGHVEFISDALGCMEKLGIHRDLSCYKALVKVFPTGLMVPTNSWQVEFYHYPKQQDMAMMIMEQMEDNGVVPDQQFGELLAAAFGLHVHAIRKFRRMLYWQRKFRNKNPFQLPHDLPFDPLERAVLALRKMAIDLENEISVWKTREHDTDQTIFVASAQSPSQCNLLSSHPENIPLYVEGGFRVWLRDVPQTYFILKAESDPKLFSPPKEKEELGDFETIFDSESPRQLVPKLNEHQQEDGTIMAMCITETSSKDSLISWIRCLQNTNPILEKAPIVFTLASPEEGLVPMDTPETKAISPVKSG